MKGTITKRMTIGEIIQNHPETVDVMLNSGLHCLGCHVAISETIEQGCKAHGLSDEEIDNMIKEMNKKAKNTTVHYNGK